MFRRVFYLLALNARSAHAEPNARNAHIRELTRTNANLTHESFVIVIVYFSGHRETDTFPLGGLQSWLMKASMSRVAWAAAPGQQGATDRKTTLSWPHHGQSPLWSILDSPGMTIVALVLFTSAWELAKHHGVGHMQHTHQLYCHCHYGCKVSDSNEYYEVKKLYMNGFTFSNPRNAGGDGGTAGGGGCGGGCGAGCGGGCGG
ncbi:hypothetical protein Vretifemale_15313 [Volvox reticuliferus]|uniref:Uncharacterized protein n=2 Tax=Volvox reticuliferus TaxID=1737510 RepID=A0A8J4CRN5_9CHLO|nr:hypothetical protein Vretifemale_15313 [Volvox reticuliferus]